MTRNLVCSECGGTMQIGYIPDASYGAIFISSWIEGKVERNLFGWPKIKGIKQFYILAYRCDHCGLLKFYTGSESNY